MNIYKIMILSTALIFVGCETGVKNKKSTDKKIEESGKSGIVVDENRNYKPYIPKSSEIKKIFSNSGTPGYYIQVGYFKERKPTNEFINRMKFSQLPYILLKKGQGEYALIGPYISYNKANEILGSARDFVTSSAFIIKLVRP